MKATTQEGGDRREKEEGTKTIEREGTEKEVTK
jgi:hypothetical protein